MSRAVVAGFMRLGGTPDVALPLAATRGRLPLPAAVDAHEALAVFQTALLTIRARHTFDGASSSVGLHRTTGIGTRYRVVGRRATSDEIKAQDDRRNNEPNGRHGTILANVALMGEKPIHCPESCILTTTSILCTTRQSKQIRSQRHARKRCTQLLHAIPARFRANLARFAIS